MFKLYPIQLKRHGCFNGLLHHGYLFKQCLLNGKIILTYITEEFFKLRTYPHIYMVKNVYVQAVSNLNQKDGFFLMDFSIMDIF